MSTLTLWFLISISASNGVAVTLINNISTEEGCYSSMSQVEKSAKVFGQRLVCIKSEVFIKQ